MIDLSRYLTSVDLDVEARTASAQGGALWEDVDNATCPHGLAPVGGTVSHVSLRDRPKIPPDPSLTTGRLALAGASSIEHSDIKRIDNAD